MRIRGCLLILSLGLLAGGAAAGTAPGGFPTGQITERVVAGSDTTQSYALYLPAGYTPDRKWPLLLCFDPGARGKVPVELFRPAAEKYGWIVAGSNNSENGPWERIEAAIAAMWSDTRARFAVDERRIYTTGFSGGSRVSLEVALRYPENVAGVIVCCGGMPEGRTLPEPVPFAAVLAAGRKDFNYLEIRLLDEIMARRQAVHRLALFEGAHEWPPADVAAGALGWFEVLAMGRGLREKDPALAGALLAESLGRARDLAANGRLPEAIGLLDGLVRDYQGLADTGAAASELAELRKAPVLKDLEKTEQKRRKIEVEYQTRGSQIWKQLQDTREEVPDLSKAIKDFKINELLAAARNLKGTEDGYLAARQVNWVLIEAYFEAPVWRRHKDLERELFCRRLMVAILPDRAEIHYNLAATLAVAGEVGEAFTSLRTAVDKGFADAAQLESDPDFAPLRSNPAFQSLLAALKQKK
jgi:pimeloyl-ACP methyl ester carboxylesterase